MTPDSETGYMDDFNSRAHVERDLLACRRALEFPHFNSRAHVERDPLSLLLPLSVPVFQLTRSRGARPNAQNHKQKANNFNSRAHVERDRQTVNLAVPIVSFQLTRSRGARQRPPSRLRRWAYFNSRAHVERDKAFFSPLRYAKISTHALTWSATRNSHRRCGAIRYFNSRAHVERDPRHLPLSTTRLIFQLTRSRGARRHMLGDLVSLKQISTHALTWSATPRTRCEFSLPRHFNSRAHVERDTEDKTKKRRILNFNSRAHVERDRQTVNLAVPIVSFQLTRSRGARQTAAKPYQTPRSISTHALTWSATSRQ